MSTALDEHGRPEPEVKHHCRARSCVVDHCCWGMDPASAEKVFVLSSGRVVDVALWFLD